MCKCQRGRRETYIQSKPVVPNLFCLVYPLSHFAMSKLPTHVCQMLTIWENNIKGHIINPTVDSKMEQSSLCVSFSLNYEWDPQGQNMGFQLNHEQWHYYNSCALFDITRIWTIFICNTKISLLVYKAVNRLGPTYISASRTHASFPTKRIWFHSDLQN